MRCLAVLLGGVLIAGCAKVGVTRLDQSFSPRPENCHLDIYTDTGKIPRAYREVCLIDSQTGTTAFANKTVAAAIELARPAACSCGADAIIVSGTATEGISMAGWGRGSAIIKAIVYLPAPSTPQQPGE